MFPYRDTIPGILPELHGAFTYALIIGLFFVIAQSVYTGNYKTYSTQNACMHMITIMYCVVVLTPIIFFGTRGDNIMSFGKSANYKAKEKHYNANIPKV
jgi:hypothetical protein